MVCPMRFVLVGLSVVVAALSTLLSWVRREEAWSDEEEEKVRERMAGEGPNHHLLSSPRLRCPPAALILTSLLSTHPDITGLPTP